MPVPAAFTLIITVITGGLAVIYSLIEQKDFLKLNHRNIFVAKNAAVCNFGRMCVRTLINLTAIGQNLGQICDIDASIMLICVSKPPPPPHPW